MEHERQKVASRPSSPNPKTWSITGETWDERQLDAFRLFHRHCALFINSAYGESCCIEYMIRVQEQACRTCRESNQLLLRHNDQEESYERNTKQILLQLGRQNLIDGDHGDLIEGSIKFPVYCLAVSCGQQYMYIYRSQLYLEQLTYGLVGDNAGWILRKNKVGFNWRRWNERDKGYERKKSRLEWDHKKSVYEQQWVEKWVCPDCGAEMPYNEDDEIRRDIARLKRLSVMFGELENYSDDEEDDKGINFTRMKVSEDVWCLRCKEKYRPRGIWNKDRWEKKLKAYEVARRNKLMNIKQQVEENEERMYRQSLPPVSSWWRRHCQEKERKERKYNEHMETAPSAPLIEFAFTGSPYKFSDSNNLGGSLWQRLASFKSYQDVKIALIGLNAVLSTATDSVADSKQSKHSVELNIPSAEIELDGIGEGYCIDTAQASKISTRIDWSVGKSHGNLKFLLDATCNGLSDVLRSKLDHCFDYGPGYYCRAIVSLASNEGEKDKPNGSIMLEDQLSESQSKSITAEYSELIRTEGSFEEENILRKYVQTTGFDTVPLVIEVVMLIPIDSEPSERGNFSVGLTYNVDGTKLDPMDTSMFGKDAFSWGICEDVTIPFRGMKAFPSLKFDNKEIIGAGSAGSTATARPVTTSRLRDDDEGITYSFYERGRKLYSIPNILAGDKIRILLDPCTGRLTVSVLSVPAVSSDPTQNSAIDSLQLFESTFIARHHTFRVPVGPLDNYEIGCTLNASQSICLLSSMHQQSKGLSFTNNGLLAESLKSRSNYLYNLPNTTQPANAVVENVTHGTESPTEDKDSLGPLGLKSLRIQRSAILVRGPSLREQALMRLGTPSIYTNDGVQIDEKRLTKLTEEAKNKASLNNNTSSLQLGASGDKPSLSKFVARRRNALSSLGVQCQSIPELLDRSDSDSSWEIGVPGIIPIAAFGDAGWVSLDMEDLISGPSIGSGIFTQDSNREVFIVRIAYEPPSKPGSSKTQKDDTIEKLVKGLSKWALGYCVRGPGKQAQGIWISKNNGELNKIKLITTNSSIYTGRIQYLLDNNVSMYKWRKGSLYNPFKEKKKKTKSEKDTAIVAEEQFTIPKKAAQIIHEFIGDWEIIQYVVRAEIQGCVWPGVYYKHVYHNNMPLEALPTAADWEKSRRRMSTVDIKRLRPGQVATKLSPVKSSPENEHSKVDTSRAAMQPIPEDHTGHEEHAEFLPEESSELKFTSFNPINESLADSYEGRVGDYSPVMEGLPANEGSSFLNDDLGANSDFQSFAINNLGPIASSVDISSSIDHKTDSSVDVAEILAGINNLNLIPPNNNSASAIDFEVPSISPIDFKPEIVDKPHQNSRKKKKSSKSVTDEEMAWSLARDFVLTERSKTSSNENAIFPFMGKIIEIHVTKVEFLCHI